MARGHLLAPVVGLVVGCVLMVPLGAADSQPSSAGTRSTAMGGSVTTEATRSSPLLRRVVVAPGDQDSPTASSKGLAWVDDKNVARYGHHVWYRAVGKAPVRVDRSGRFGSSPSLVGDSGTIVYQQYTELSSGIYSYDTATGRRTLVPGLVNSPAFEFRPVASEHAIIFLRCLRRTGPGDCGRITLLMFNRDNGRLRTLVADVGDRQIEPAYAGRRYVAWTQCGTRTCRATYLDRRTGRVKSLYNPRGFMRYAPTIDEPNHLIYFGQSRLATLQCTDTSIRRAHLGARTSEGIWRWQARVDIGWTMSLTAKATGRQDLYLQRWECQTGLGDIYKLVDVG